MAQKVTCERCMGSRAQLCLRCEGTGKMRPCTHCKGKGCAACFGLGALACAFPEFWDGVAACERCNGSGAVDCGRCNGTGQHNA